MKKLANLPGQAIAALGISAMLMFTQGVAAQSPEPISEDWKYAAEMYAWLPEIKSEDEAGNTSTITLDDILSNLDFTAMLSGGARKGKWSLATDLIYMNLSNNTDDNLGPILQLDEIELEAWIVSPTVGYTIYQNQDHVVNVFAGARYLWLDLSLKVKARIPAVPPSRKLDGSNSFWDGIVGIRGRYQFDEKWSTAYSFSGGTGDSDSTWQATVGTGYRFDAVSAVLGWRYLTWEFDSGSPAKNLTINGPYLGAIYRF